MQMFGDCPRGFEGIAVSGIHYKLSGRHHWALEGAGLLELTKLVDIAELAESLA